MVLVVTLSLAIIVPNINVKASGFDYLSEENADIFIAVFWDLVDKSASITKDEMKSALTKQQMNENKRNDALKLATGVIAKLLDVSSTIYPENITLELANEAFSGISNAVSIVKNYEAALNDDNTAGQRIVDSMQVVTGFLSLWGFSMPFWLGPALAVFEVAFHLADILAGAAGHEQLQFYKAELKACAVQNIEPPYPPEQSQANLDKAYKYWYTLFYVQYLVENNITVPGGHPADDDKSYEIPTDAITFNGHSYKVFNESKTWQEAKEYCESVGGHLATVASETENNFIKELVVSNNYKNAYLGATDEVTEGIWKWVTGEEFNYTSWGKGEPNNEGRREHYLLFNSNGSWNDIPNEEWPFICEWDYINNDETYEIIKDTGSFGGHSYKVFDESMTWWEARDYCESVGGHLVTIASNSEHQFICDLIISSNISKRNVWIGGYIENGLVHWVTGEKFVFEAWNVGEPNNVFGTQDAIMMYTDKAGNQKFKWNDENGNGRNWSGYYLSDFGFICEWENNITIPSDHPADGKITVSNTSGKPGDIVTVTISISDNPGITLLALSMQYDRNALQLIGCSDIGTVLSNPFQSGTLTTYPFNMVWDTYPLLPFGTNNTNNGLLIAFTFKILYSAQVGETDIIITYLGDDHPKNALWESVDFNLQNGKVFISENPLISIDLNKANITLNKTQTEVLTVSYNPINTTDDTSVIWSTSNSSVAKVEYGEVTAINPGTSIITARVGTKTSNCIVTVNKINQSPLIITDPSSKTYGDAAFQLSTSTTGSGTGNVIYEYVSGPGTVTSGGIVTITGAGSIVVKAIKAGDNTYNSATSANLSITVNKANPFVTWPTDLTAIFGQTLSMLTLPSDSMGTFLWTTPDNYVGLVGTQSHSITFIPKNSNNYNTIIKNVNITVKEDLLTNIELINPPNKLEYILGESLDLTGAKLKAYYNYGSPAVIDVTYDMVYGYNKNVSGEQTITVTYKEFVTSFKITVINPYPTDDCAKAGDATGDGRITALDALIIRQQCLGGYDLTGIIDMINADANKDGIVNMADSMITRQFHLGGYGVVISDDGSMLYYVKL